MKYGFYFRLLKIFHNEFICCLLANILYCLYCLKYILKKIKRKKYNIEIGYDQALDCINKVYPHPKSVPEYVNPEININLDLSIVIPIFNYVDIIEKNIMSVLNQRTRYNFEIILVDDGSTDGASEIVKKFQNYNNVKAFFQKNAGIGAARNTGINNANGKYIMFVDCDDIVHDDLVEVLLNEAYREDFDMVMCGHNLSKERDGIVISKIPNIYPKRNLNNYKNNDEIMNLAGLPWCKVYKRELWNNVRFFPGYWYEDDIIQFLIFTQDIRFSYIQKIEYEYKWYEKNFSHTQNNNSNIKTIDSYWLLIDILQRYKKNGLPNNEILYTLILRHISTYYYTMIRGLDNALIEALFVLARRLYMEYKPSYRVKLPYMLRQVEKAFDENDIELWKLASTFQ